MSNHKRNIYFLFCLSLLVRILFKWLTPYDNFELFYDSIRYDNLSNKIISGDYNLDVVAYLIAPLYPYTLALFKTISSQNWEVLTMAYQFLLVAISTVYLYKISWLLFENKRAALLTGLLYIFYPLTLWYNFTIVQETSFQAFFIFFIFYFLQNFKSEQKLHLILAGSFFALAMLTKSHILILIPFLLLNFFLLKKLKEGFIFCFIIFLFTIPHGLVNLKIHDTYTLSSQGNASLFLLGHSDVTYPCLTHSSGEMGPFSAAGCDPSIVFDLSYEYKGFGKANALPPKERNSIRWKIALDWIKNNPSKFFELKWHGIKRFIIPGLDYKVYKFSYWLLSFFAGLFIYLPAYWVLFSKFKTNPIAHLLAPSLIIIIAAVFILFFPINRFRVITLEPYLMVYAGLFYSRLLFKKLERA